MIWSVSGLLFTISGQRSRWFSFSHFENVVVPCSPRCESIGTYPFPVASLEQQAIWYFWATIPYWEGFCTFVLCDYFSYAGQRGEETPLSSLPILPGCIVIDFCVLWFQRYLCKGVYSRKAFDWWHFITFHRRDLKLCPRSWIRFYLIHATTHVHVGVLWNCPKCTWQSVSMSILVLYSVPCTFRASNTDCVRLHVSQVQPPSFLSCGFPSWGH